jgi:iron complex outermembrane receptor protein
VPSLPAFFRSLIVVASLTAALLASASAATIEFDVPTQAADRALLLLSKQAKIEIVFSSDAVRDLKSTPVVGRHEPKDALALLLQGTGLVARRNFLGKFVVAPAPAPPGQIRGKMVTADSRPARDIRVSLRETGQTALTDERGEFAFEAVPPGVYRVVAAANGYQTVLVSGDARVESGHRLVLEPQTIRTGYEPTRLDPVVVEGRSDHAPRFAEDPTGATTQVATGNLDLPRTPNDALPYTVFTREQISRSGMVNLNEFLQRNVLDSDAVTRPPEQQPGMDRNLDSFSAGSANLKLRGFGAEETVVLVNGRRLPEALISGPSVAQVQTPDVNFIPLSLVDRVEVLPIAASALYSGNAVGGVINIILRPDVDATELTTTYTNTLGGFDAPQSAVSLQHGQTLLHGKLHLRFNATFSRTQPTTEAEQGYIRTNLARRSVTADALHRATPNLASAEGVPLFGPGTATFTSVAPGTNGQGGLVALANRAGRRSEALFDAPGGMGNSPDSSDFPYGRQQEGYSYFGSAIYDVRPWLQLGFDGIITRNVLHRGYAIFPGDLSLDASSPLNPLGQDLTVSLNETAPRLGENYSEARIDFSSAVLGALIRLPGDWRVSLDGQYGHSVTRYRGLAGVDSTRWQELVDAGLYNPLRDTQVFGPPPEFYDRALIYYGGPGRFVTLGNYDTLDGAVRISNRALALPTGSAALNFGADYRRNHLQSFTNEQRYGDGTLVEDPGKWSARTLERLSAFAELQAPLVPTRWLPRVVRATDLDLAARYVAAATAQETNLAPTAGLKVDFVGGWSLRATIATSNRLPPPALNRRILKAPVNTGTGGGDVSFGSITDPLRGNSRYGVPSTEELNPDLRPEAAVSRSFGLIWQRGKVHRVRAAIDFIDTQKSGELHLLETQETVDLENVFPGRVERGPLAPGDPFAVGPISSVLTGTVNLAWRHSQNWSTAVDYAWNECLGGRFEAYARWIYFERYDVQLLPNSPIVNELRHPDRSSPGLMRHRLNFGGEWSNGPFGFGCDGHYFHSRILPVADWTDQGRDRIRPHWQFDTFVQRDLTRWLPGKPNRFGLRAQLRVNNVLNAPPPKYVNDPSQTGVQVYGDWRGRVYSLSLTATF